MNKEDDMELEEYTSPKITSYKNNSVHISPVNTATYSVSSISDDDDIRNIFSVNRTYDKQINEGAPSEKRTISEISDDVFQVKSEMNVPKIISQKPYKQKITQHLKKIRKNARTPSRELCSKSRHTIPIDKIRSEDMNAEVEMVRNRFKLKNKTVLQSEKEEFLKFSLEKNNKLKDGDGLNQNNECVQYKLPENMNFSINVSKKECCIYNPMKKINKNVKIGSLEPVVTNRPKLTKFQINLLEQRLLSENNRSWFDINGDLVFCNIPITEEIFRPIPKEVATSFYTYRTPFIGEDCTEVKVDNILDIHLSHLKFCHHPLFSIEHAFAEKLKNLFDEYIVFEMEKILESLRNKLLTLRLKRNQQELSEEITGDVNEEVKKARELYFEKAHKYRSVVNSILYTWKQIKKIRENQSFTNTSVKLLIKKETVNIDEDNEQYKKFYEETLEEMFFEHKLKHNISEPSDENNEENNAELVNATGINEEESSRPHQNIALMKEKIIQEVNKTFRKIFRSPGEPLVHFSLTEGVEITKDVEDINEIQRRSAVNAGKFFLKILCKSIEVCKTKIFTMNQNFFLDINESLSIYLTDIPKCLTVEVFEIVKKKQMKKLCILNLPIPISESSKVIFEQKFEKRDTVQYKHTGVGSGVDLKCAAERFGIKVPNKENIELKIKGLFSYRMEWDKKPNLHYQRETSQHQDTIFNDVFDKYLDLDYDKLQNMCQSNKEFNENAELFRELVSEEHKDYFRLDAHTEDLHFGNITEIEQNIRLKILRLRNQKEIEFDGLPVPNRIKEIPFDILSDYTNRKSLEEKGYFVDELEYEDEIQAQRNMGKKYLKQIYIRVFQKCKNTDYILEYESVVNERVLIHFNTLVKTIIENFLNWFRWRPKISKPLPILMKTSSKEDIMDGLIATNNNVQIIVSIISAKNVPNRTKNTFKRNYSETNDVQPFIRIDYKNTSIRTDTADGTNPVWNQTLCIPLETIHTDYLNPNSLEGKLVINLFDESDIEVKKLNNKKCANWLGSVDVPISAVCSPEGMKGIFKVKLPRVLLGYETEADKFRMKSPKIGKIQANHTYLEMEFIIKPDIPKLSPNLEKLPSADIPFIEEHILKWNNNYNSSFPDRKFSALAINTNSKTACLTRYLRPLEPPQLKIYEFDVTPEQCLRFVSLIPFTNCNNFYSNIWLHPHQLLQLMIGSINDHATALCCYLLGLKMDVWLVLGYGIPHGHAAWVFSKEYTTDQDVPTHYIYDVVQNEKYNVTDEFCTLLKIYCVLNGENIWANIQRTDNVNLIRYDFTKKSDWLPLFNVHISAPVNFVTNKVQYKSSNNLNELEFQLEKQLRRQISKLRQLDRTIWNPHLSTPFKDVLRSFEMNCMYNKNHFETTTELKTVTAGYEVTGFVLNIPFTSLSAISKSIKNLGIHIKCETENEFGISVYMHQYPGNVISVWIILASVKTKENSI